MNHNSISASAGISSLLDSSNQSRLSPSSSSSSTASFGKSFSSRPTEDEGHTPGDSTALNFDRLPIEQLLQSEWFHQNLSQMLNISVDNLTTLLYNAQHHYNAVATNSSGIHHGGIMMRDPPWLLATLTTFYALIFFAGILGNLITCIVISRIKFMHTATNFYLFNLAVSDLILLLSGMPQELYNTWYPEEYPFNDVLCKMEGIFSETAANATVLTITAFTVERYIAICHPFRQHTMSKLSRAIKFIFAIWVTAFLLALPQAMQFSVVPQNNGLECTMENDFFAHVFAVSGFIFFGGPMTAICVLYVLIGMKLKRSRLLQSLPRRCYDVNRGISAQSRVIRMLVAVAVAFFLCWAPFHAQRLMAAYGSTADVTSALFNQVYHVLNYISGVLYFLSTCINPLLYNIMSHKFREAFKVTLARKFGLNGTYTGQNHHYSALLRQNGSMRMNTTVNSNAFEHLNSYRVVQLQCRDPTHHLSLQDSIRTTTTTTTINSASGCSGSSGASSSCRSSSHRNRCISNGSQSTLLNSLNKSEGVYSTTQRSNADHRVLQTQISQLSSVGDASSLLETDDMGNSCHPHTHSMSYRLKELRNSDSSANASGHNGRSSSLNSRAVVEPPVRDADCYSVKGKENKLGILATPVAPQIMAATLVATQPVQPLNSIAELTVGQPSRSRLKMSRIISRRERDVLVTQKPPRVELMHRHLPGMGHQQLQPVYKKRQSVTDDLFDSFRLRPRQQPQPQQQQQPQLQSHLKTKDSRKAIKDTLSERFRWRTKRGKRCMSDDGDDGDDGQRFQRESTTAATHKSAPALKRIVYPTTKGTSTSRGVEGGELPRRNGGVAGKAL